MIAGAIFDLDGTILDSMAIWGDAPGRYLGGMGIETELGLGKTLFPMSMAEGAEYLKDRCRLDMTVDDIMEGINHTVTDFYSYQVQLKEGAARFLRALKQNGVKTTAATSSDRQVLERALERLNVLNCFDRMFTCTEVGAGKIKPDIFLAAAEHMGTFPGDTWVFEDSLYAIQTAKNAGFRTVGVYDASSAENEDEIRRISDIYLEKLDYNRFTEAVSNSRTAYGPRISGICFKR